MHLQRNVLVRAIGVVGLIAVGFSPALAHAEHIKIGILKTPPSGLVFIALDRGYFAAEGLDVELSYFEAGQPIALATAAASIDFGANGPSAAFYNLAGEGVLRIISGMYREAPSFRILGYVASTHAVAAGLTSLKDLPHHSLAVSQVGSPPHYALALLAEKYHFELDSIKLLAMQSVPNMISALSGGQADATIITGAAAVAIDQRKEGKLLGWVGDETPWQMGVLWTSTKIIRERQDMIGRFLRAYRRGARDYHDAFTGSNEERADGPTTTEIVAIIAKYTGLAAMQIEQTVAYTDPALRIDVNDIRHQILWFRSQGMIKGDFHPDTVIDKHYAVALSD
jgi:NitT/TauT family transport system substrate-binding protein